MRVAFFGMFEYGSLVLQGLLEAGLEVACVVTVHQDPHREPYFETTPLHEVARAAGLPLHEPESVKTDKFRALLASYKPDMGAIALFDKLLPAEVLRVPNQGFLNAHPSLLPAYRGPTPHNWVLINGETKTGVSIHQVNPEMDSGAVLLQASCAIGPDDTADVVMHKIAKLASKALPEGLKQVEAGKAHFMPQDPARATYFPRRREAYGIVLWWKSAQEIYNLYRGMLPRPGAFTYHHSRKLGLLKAKLAPSPSSQAQHLEAGGVLQVTPEGVWVQCGQGQVLLEELLLEGQPVAANEYAAQYKLVAGDHLG